MIIIYYNKKEMETAKGIQRQRILGQGWFRGKLLRRRDV